MPYPFSNDVLTRFSNQGEVQYSDEKFFLTDRIAIEITAGVSTYTLPDYVRSIRRVTWLGMKLDPLGQRNLRESFQSAAQRGRPWWYIFNNIGINKIQFFPIPDQNLPDSGAFEPTAFENTAFNTSAGSLYGAGILALCIVEFWRISDNDRFIIPLYQRRQMLKHFVNRQIYSLDGPGNNLKLVQYFGARWELRKKQMTELIDEFFSKPRKYVIQEIISSNYFPASPVLPISRFGVSVNEGE